MSPQMTARFRFPHAGRLGAVVLRLAVLLALGGGATALSQAARAADDEASAEKPRTLTLSQAEESALRYQPTMRQARAQTDAAQGRVEQARAGYLPQATGTGL